MKVLRHVMRTTVVLGLVLSIPTAAHADEPPPTGRVIVDVVTVWGGCAPGTIAVSVAPDNTAFGWNYGGFTARAGGGALPGEARKSCKVSLRLVPPPGYTWAVKQADTGGFAGVAAGAVASHKWDFAMTGQPPVFRPLREYRGPYLDDWHETEVSDRPYWAPCDQTPMLNVASELRVAAGTSDPRVVSQITEGDAFSGDPSYYQTAFGLAWKKC